MTARLKILLVRTTPWWILRAAWRSRLVDRTTVFRWEMNAFLGDWEGPCPASP